MRDFDEPQRAAGPGVVVEGPPHAPTVLVIDPAGAGSHGEIPATWRELTEHLRVVWLRAPAAPAWVSTMDEVLTRHRRDKASLDIVTSGPIAAEVLSLASRHRELIRAVLLVDPEVPDLSAEGVDVRVVAAHGDESPLPLGHPDVVIAVVRSLLALDEGEDLEPRRSGASLVWQAVYAVWESLAQRASSRK
ncbi:hypothetical protein Lesp02_22220 [Lentzea sp. NBRC 105346]|uniref:hypothetical protein n=1 Tax=Lentzea sp. NBRC 105346 TaxID=3032205 RepID=UPI0024A5B9B4|nr:hypothetical protein [Lentzea sp. NBRC 105346]GLZ30032.1 hypothetical protein Lesp02_22220 [Lentzea sp. NBRC 105346]